MPERETIKRARKDKREGKSASTQAGEFVREEIHHIREGEAWRALGQAGDCHRPVKGASSWSAVTGTEKGRGTGARAESG